MTLISEHMLSQSHFSTASETLTEVSPWRTPILCLLMRHGLALLLCLIERRLLKIGGFLRLAQSLQNSTQSLTGVAGVGMLCSQNVFPNRKGLLVEREGLGELLLHLPELCQVVQGLCKVWMLWTQMLTANGERALVMRIGLQVLTLVPREVG